MSWEKSLLLADEQQTADLARQLAGLLQPDMVIWLQGDLGVGKTTLVRHVLRALGFVGPVKSPSYALVEVYPVSSLYLHHFDFYRFATAEEFVESGLEEYFGAQIMAWIEWPERAIPYVPAADCILTLRHVMPAHPAPTAADDNAPQPQHDNANPNNPSNPNNPNNASNPNNPDDASNPNNPNNASSSNNANDPTTLASTARLLQLAACSNKGKSCLAPLFN